MRECLGSESTSAPRLLELRRALKATGSLYNSIVGRPGLNHIGYQVEDIEGVGGRLRAAGYTESTVENVRRYRKRIYVYGPDRNDWEFVHYLTDDSTKRHDYELPDR